MLTGKLEKTPNHLILAGAALVSMFLITVLGLILVRDIDAALVIRNYLITVVNLFAAICLFIAAHSAKGYARGLTIGWGLLAVAHLGYVIAEVLWAVLEAAGALDRFAVIPEILFILYYPVLFLGIVTLPVKKITVQEGIKRTLDIAILFIANVLVLWTFIIGPIFQSMGDLPYLEKVIALAYPFGDILLFAVFLALNYYRMKVIEYRALVLLTFGAMAKIAADIGFEVMDTYLVNLDIFVHTSITTSYLLFGLAALSQAKQLLGASPMSTNPSGSSTFQRNVKWIEYFPYMAVILAYLLLFSGARQLTQSIDYSSLLIIVGVVILIVIVRQVLTFRENDRLFRDYHTALERVRKQADDLSQSNVHLQNEIQERARLEARLSYASLHDPLTGLANRALFIEKLGQAIENKKRYPQFGFAVLFLDLDNFKWINDNLGHSVGDDVLVEIGRRLRGCTRAIDTVARFGGDEFVLLLENPYEEENGPAIAQRILDRINRPMLMRGKEIELSSSVGIVDGLATYDSPEDVVRDVDIAMYRAKEMGKGRFEIFNVDMREEVNFRLTIERKLPEALRNNEFALHYQPIYQLDSRKVIGFEALLRWNHPQLGLLLPGTFLEQAEKSGHIVEIGRFVLYEACRQMAAWKKQFPHLQHATISVNVSGKQLNEPGFVQDVMKAIHDTGLNAKSLQLEITETVLIDRMTNITGILNDIRGLGVKLAIDDFGSGYSSFSYIRELPVDILKIDKGFVDYVAADERHREVVKAIISMAGGLGMNLVAEGIETKEQYTSLNDLQCATGQGYFFSRPIPAEEITEMIGKG